MKKLAIQIINVILLILHHKLKEGNFTKDRKNK